METSVLFIIIKIWLSLCSHLISPHAPIPPPERWWSQLLKSTICSIIFNYPAFTVSITPPPSSVVNRNHLLIDSVGQLASTVITADWCHTDTLQVPPTEKHSPTHHHFVTKTQHFQSRRFVENLRDYIIILYLHTPLCPASQLSKMRREVDVVLRVCFAFSALTRRFWCFKVSEKLFFG